MEELERQRIAYRALASKLNNAHVIDGSADENKVLSDAEEIIIDYLHNRYIERRKLWFEEDPYSCLDWLNSILSPDNKKTMFKISESKKSGNSSEWGTYKKFRFLLLNDGRGYLFPNKRNLYSRAVELYNVQGKKAKLFKQISKLTKGYPFIKPVRLMISRDMKKADRNRIHFLEYIKKMLKRNDIEFAISLGTPGPDRKPVIQILTSEGKVVGFVKIGDELTNNLIVNEADAITGLSQLAPVSFCFPELIYKGWWNNHYFLIQSTPSQKLLSAPQRINSCHVEFLKELADVNPTRITLDKSIFWQELNEKIESISEKNHYYNIAREVLVRVQNEIDNTLLPFHMCHGDFAPWNTYLDGKKLFLFDWEYSVNQALPGRDLFHFIVQTNYLLKKTGPTETYYRALEGFDSGLESSYWEKIGIGKDVGLALFILYVLDRLVSIISKDQNKYNELTFFTNIINHYLSVYEEKS